MKAVRGVVNGSGLNGLEREINDEIAGRLAGRLAVSMRRTASGAASVT